MNLARVLADLAVKIMPASRRSWAEAARAELDYVPADSALRFAVGGLATAMRFKLVSTAFVLGSVRYGLAVAASAWAFAAARLVFHFRGVQDPLLAIVLLSSTAIFGLGALIVALAGLRAARLLMLPVLAATAACAVAGAAFTPRAPNLAFYRALATEDAGVLFTAFLLASCALAYGRRHARPTG